MHPVCFEQWHLLDLSDNHYKRATRLLPAVGFSWHILLAIWCAHWDSPAFTVELRLLLGRPPCSFLNVSLNTYKTRCSTGCVGQLTLVAASSALSLSICDAQMVKHYCVVIIFNHNLCHHVQLLWEKYNLMIKRGRLASSIYFKDCWSSSLQQTLT